MKRWRVKWTRKKRRHRPESVELQCLQRAAQDSYQRDGQQHSNQADTEVNLLQQQLLPVVKHHQRKEENKSATVPTSCSSWSADSSNLSSDDKLTPLISRHGSQRLLTRQQSSASVLSSTSVSACHVTALFKVRVCVEGVEFDSSIMEHPEFLIRTRIVFACKQFGFRKLTTTWLTHRTFEEFKSLDIQLRRTFSTPMSTVATPRVHRRRVFFRLHRTRKFLERRRLELDAFLKQIARDCEMRLVQFLDPRAPPYLRFFCNYDAGFGANLELVEEEPDALTCAESFRLRLESFAVQEEDEEEQGDGNVNESTVMQSTVGKQQLEALKNQQKQRRLKRQKSRSNSQRQHALEANLRDDQSRNITMCMQYGCQCHNSSFRSSQDKMLYILKERGFQRVLMQETPDASALHCVVYHLARQIHTNNNQRHSFDSSTSNEKLQGEEEIVTSRKLCENAGTLREIIATYGLLQIDTLVTAFRMTTIELKRKLHAFKNKRHTRVGAMELVILCTALNLSIKLLTNDPTASVHDIHPLPELPSLRSGDRIFIPLAYLLPTTCLVDGYYFLVEANPSSMQVDPDLTSTGEWQGMDHVVHNMAALIDQKLSEDLSGHFDARAVDRLNKAILDAVWNDCQHNPRSFSLFEHQASQFGKKRISAGFFFQYLEVAFGFEGATYLVDFLVHILPEKDLRHALERTKWRRIRHRFHKKTTEHKRKNRNSA